MEYGPNWYMHPSMTGADIPRRVMPQIEEADYPALLRFLGSIDVEVKHRIELADSLIHRQAMDAFDPARVGVWEAITKPVIVARDGSIIDGNHRAMAAQYIGQPYIPTLRIMRPFEPAIASCFAFPLTSTVRQGV